MSYIQEHTKWPAFFWDTDYIIDKLGALRYRQGKLLGKMESLGFELQQESSLAILTADITQSSSIEGEYLNPHSVRSSVAKRLGIELACPHSSDQKTEGIVEMMLDATQNYSDPITLDRLCGWHAALFPTGFSGMHKISVGRLRGKDSGVMKVVSGAMGKEKTHFIAPSYDRLPGEMEQFIHWANHIQIDSILKSALAHFWFVTIHPFEDGNGRITRALGDLYLARSDHSKKRFYSMSSQIQVERKSYYNILEQSQKGSTDITNWLEWYLDCLDRAISRSETQLQAVWQKSRVWDLLKKSSANDRQKKVINKLFDNFEGKLTNKKYAKFANCSPDTALRDLRSLIDMEVIIKLEGGGRNTSYWLKECFTKI